MCFDPPVGASVCPPQAVYLTSQLLPPECYYLPASEACRYDANLEDYTNFVYPIDIEIIDFAWLGGNSADLTPPLIVNSIFELKDAVDSKLNDIILANGLLRNPIDIIASPTINDIQLTLQNVDNTNSLVSVEIRVGAETRSDNFIEIICGSPQSEQNWLKLTCINGDVRWYDTVNNVLVEVPPPGLLPCVISSGINVKYQPVCVDGTTQLTRADLWQDGSLLSSLYLDESGAIVPTPIGDVLVGSCPVPILTTCYYKRVSASCLYRSNIVINPPSPVYPFDIHVTELNWVGGGGLAVLPPQTVNDDTEANAAVKAMIEAIASANGLIGYPVNADPNLFYIGGIPNNGYRAIVEIENIDQSNAIIDYTIDIGGVVTMSNFSEISCNNVPIDPQEYWEKIVYPDGSIVWWDSVNCVFGTPPDGLVLCGSEVNFIGRSKELGAGETWAITTDVGGILQSVTFNILSGTGQYIDLPTLTPTTYPIGNWSWGVNGAIDNENLLVGTMTVGVGGAMIVQWTERV